MTIKIIRCRECGSQSRIYSRNNLSRETVDFYCQCLACGYRFVSQLMHKHAIDNSHIDKLTVFKDHLSTLTPAQRNEYKQALIELEA